MAKGPKFHRVRVGQLGSNQTWQYMAMENGKSTISHRIHGAAIYGNMDPINIPPMLAYIPCMDPMGYNAINEGMNGKIIEL